MRRPSVPLQPAPDVDWGAFAAMIVAPLMVIVIGVCVWIGGGR
jgi:hypothetical protein